MIKYDEGLLLWIDIRRVWIAWSSAIISQNRRKGKEKSIDPGELKLEKVTMTSRKREHPMVSANCKDEL